MATDPGVGNAQPAPYDAGAQHIRGALRLGLGDRYDVEDVIGQGGMALVYAAHDRKHHRRVAIKVLRRDDARSLGAERFLREIEIIARLTHPNILPLHDSGAIAAGDSS